MTVLVGVLCQDGVVVGSDSSATFSIGPGLHTIEQPVQKTFLVGPDILFATAGAAGLGQRLEYVLQSLRQQTENWLTLHHLQIATQVTREMLQNMRLTFVQPGHFGALMAFSCRDTFHLCEFALSDFQPEMKTPDSWFVSMGSGQLITDPFFGLLRRTLFRDAPPTLDEGIEAAYWALHNAILLNAGGINGPVQLATLRRPAPGAGFQARLFGEEELGERARAVARIEDYLARYRERLPPPPPPRLAPLPGPTPPAEGSGLPGNPPA